MTHSIYLINPSSDFCGHCAAEVFAASGLPPAVLTADPPAGALDAELRARIAMHKQALLKRLATIGTAPD